MLGKLAELFLFGLAPLAFAGLLVPGAFAAEEVAVAGEVSYRERIALPANAVLTVRLMDVSLADAPEAVVAEQTVDPAGQVPIRFELKLDPAVVQPGATYALQARITVDDQLWFINDERYAVDPLKPEPAQMPTVLMATGGGSSWPPTPTWLRGRTTMTWRRPPRPSAYASTMRPTLTGWPNSTRRP